MSPQQPVSDRRCDTQGTPITDERWAEQIGIDCAHRALCSGPPLSIEHIIAQLQQLRDLLPAPAEDGP